jgi:ribosomal protein S6-L-glutamate ligase RimK-like protein
MRGLVWIFPDRSSARQAEANQRRFWQHYGEEARKTGFDLRVISPEALEVVWRDAGHAEVWIDGVEARPGDTVFLTHLYLMPHCATDAWAQLSTFLVLQQAGHFLPIDPYRSCLVDEKVATLLHLGEIGIRSLPGVRLLCGRDLSTRDLGRLLQGFDFPLAVKPTSWGMGQGFTVARSWPDLRGILSLASGAEVPVIIQPFLEGAHDYRVYCVEGRPYLALDRRPGRGDYRANLVQGGEGSIVQVPAALREPARAVAERLDAAFCAVDFLFDGRDYHLSEVELEPGLLPMGEGEDAPGRRLLRARFEAYGRRHAAWLEQRRQPVSGAAR